MGPLEEGLVAFVTVFVGLMVLVLYAVCWGLSFLAVIKGSLYLHVKSDVSQLLGDGVPGVSIVKPLAGVDPLLETRLESHFTLTYPRFELLFCFYDVQDPAIAVVRKLQVKYPKVSVRLLCNSRDDLPNPLVRNLIQGYEAANYDYVWICSSKLQVSEQMLDDVVQKLQPPDVALVHQLPFCVTHTSSITADTLQQLYYGCTLGRYYIAFNTLGMCCVAGLSYVFKKSVLAEQKLGFLQTLPQYGHCMPHDFFITRDLHLKGYKTVMSSFPAEENVTATSLSHFVDRMVRWSRLRLNVLTLVAGVLEPLSQCLPLGLLTSYFLFLFFHIRPLDFLCGHILAWIALDMVLLRLIRTSSARPSSGGMMTCLFHFLSGWMLGQAVGLWVYVKALFSPQRIRWGPHGYHVHCGGRIVSSPLKLCTVQPGGGGRAGWGGVGRGGGYDER